MSLHEHAGTSHGGPAPHVPPCQRRLRCDARTPDDHAASACCVGYLYPAPLRGLMRCRCLHAAIDGIDLTRGVRTCVRHACLSKLFAGASAKCTSGCLRGPVNRMRSIVNPSPGALWASTLCGFGLFAVHFQPCEAVAPFCGDARTFDGVISPETHESHPPPAISRTPTGV